MKACKVKTVLVGTQVFIYYTGTNFCDTYIIYNYINIK